MRILSCLALAALAVSTPAPVMAQQQEQEEPSTGEQILRGVLDVLTGRDRTTEAPQETQSDAQMERAQTMNEVLMHPRRAEDRARDAWRHPAETLEFFDIEPGMTVVDYMPATGWYSRVLIPYLGREGNYIGLNPELHPDLTGYWDMYRNAASRIPADARNWVGMEGARVWGLNTDDELESFAGTADRVLIFREIHNMRRFGWLHDSMMAIRTLLKDDGLLGVVQHRAREDAPIGYTFGDNGYQRQEDVIRLMAIYGFELVAASEINANPNDPANWERGVWSLPPSYAGASEGSAERARRAEIGESDRMTLLFRKVS
jgi:predicted methyltransferase